MPLTASLVEFNDALLTKLRTNQGALGINCLFYGDQDRIPGTPCVCLEPDVKSSSLKGAPRRTQVNFVTYLLIYHSEVTSPQDNLRSANVLAEQIETLIHADRTLGGLVIHCMVAATDSGYVRKNNTLMRSSRLTVTAESQDMLPS